MEYFARGSATLLEGNTPRLDSSCAALTDRDSIIVTEGERSGEKQGSGLGVLSEDRILGQAA